MGAWGKLPWENDGAADWFATLFDKTRLARQVEETLQLDVEDSCEEVRAAASILIFLGHNYIWPVHDLDRHLALAADKLEKISSLDVIADSPEFVEEIQGEVRELRSRIKGQNLTQPPQTPPKKWWQFRN